MTTNRFPTRTPTSIAIEMRLREMRLRGTRARPRARGLGTIVERASGRWADADHVVSLGLIAMTALLGGVNLLTL